MIQLKANFFVHPAPFARGPDQQLSVLGEAAVDPCSFGPAETHSWISRKLVLLITLVFLQVYILYIYLFYSNCIKSKNTWYYLALNNSLLPPPAKPKGFWISCHVFLFICAASNLERFIPRHQ